MKNAWRRVVRPVREKMATNFCSLIARIEEAGTTILQHHNFAILSNVRFWFGCEICSGIEECCVRGVKWLEILRR